MQIFLINITLFFFYLDILLKYHYVKYYILQISTVPSVNPKTYYVID